MQLASASVTTAVDTAVADAKNLPQLIANVSAIDPALATQLTGKALLASKSPWGTALAGLIGYAAARYGLGWGPDVVALVSGLFVIAGAYGMRLFTKAPITSLATMPAPPAPPAVSTPVPVSVVGASS